MLVSAKEPNLSCANGRGRSGAQIAGGHPKASSRPRQPAFAAPASRELESAWRVGIFLRCCHSSHGLLFRGSAGVATGGQQQFATQTLRVHLLGIDQKDRSLLRCAHGKNKGEAFLLTA